ncbi:hypothetical protein [Micromonospora echinofusca]|uniref:Uncharacterized protein n=1 Tax=Micromonospora echinofusca TaxID=47858 RepID=A0A1C5G7S7_MICEH|nr:hypothetical protein [Micromonospora echinofusca]SCG15973.1 hypothetical protein GA0070610_2225 [Micromonospora echinofusca]
MTGQVSPQRQNINTLAITLLGVLLAGALTYACAPINKQQEDKASDPLHLGEPAFHVSVREAFHEADDGTTWVFPTVLPLEALSFLNIQPTTRSSQGIVEHQEAADRRLTDLGGRRVGRSCTSECVSVSRYRVTLTGNRKQPVHIDSMRARIRAEQPAPSGTLLFIGPEGGGPVDVVYLDLDSPKKDALTVGEDGKPTGRVFTDVENRFAEEGEPLVFELVGATRRPVRYEWELVLEVTQDGRRETVVVDLGSGKPLHTVGWIEVPRYGIKYGRNPITYSIVESAQ